MDSSRPSTVAGGAQTTLAQIAELVGQARDVVIMTHRNPDGDAIGSATALAAGLRRLGHAARVVCPDRLPPNLLSIPDAQLVGSESGDLDGDDMLVICVDVSDPRLLVPLPAADPEFLAARCSINIDHHVSNLRYARFNYIDSAAASAAEIVYELLRVLGLTIDARLATQILYGFVNDTHSFQNSNTTARTLRVAAELVEAGANLSTIVFELLLARTPSAARLWSEVLPTLGFADEGRYARMEVSAAALARAEATLPDADGLVEFLRTIRGVDLAVLFKEVTIDHYRLSMRTTEAVDATQIAGAFGGGGHRRAAGCDIPGALPDVEARVLAVYRAVREASL